MYRLLHIYLLGIIELPLVDVEQGLVEGALHGVARDAPHVLLHRGPLAQPPRRSRRHHRHPLSGGVVSHPPALARYLIQSGPGGGERGEGRGGRGDDIFGNAKFFGQLEGVVSRNIIDCET